MFIKMKKEEFKLRKELIELAHKLRMAEIEFENKCKTNLEKLKHSNELETGRIKSAEIRKSMERKADMEFARGYSK